MDPTDVELLERWRGGHSASGEVLFERYYDSVERFFLNKVSNGVQDLVQETFARCVAGRERIVSQFRLYMFGIAYRVLNSHIRERYRKGQPVDVEEVSIHDLQPGPGVFTLAAQRREHRLLLEALRRIPMGDQFVLELHYWESLTTDEIAEMLEIPVGTARGRLQRARDKLAGVMHRLTEARQGLASTLSHLDDWAQACRAQLDSCRGES